MAVPFRSDCHLALKNDLGSVQEVISIKISSVEKAKLRRLAEARGIKLSELLREGVAEAARKAEEQLQLSCYELTRKYFEEPGHIGASGLTDLSTNKDHLKGLGEKASRR